MGGVTRGLQPSSLTHFISDFKTDAEKIPNLVKTGGKAIAQSMAKLEVYPITYKQAVTTAKAHAKRYGGNYADYIMPYRLGTEVTQYDDIRRRRAELFAQHKTKEEVRLTISEEFYGSQ
jgi:hypothetical protein